jgi:hypothetical protein
MWDKRVVRGSTYAPPKIPVVRAIIIIIIMPEFVVVCVFVVACIRLPSSFTRHSLSHHRSRRVFLLLRCFFSLHSLMITPCHFALFLVLQIARSHCVALRCVAL